MSSYCVLVTGGNRGIGLEFVRQFVESENVTQVFATCRSPEKAHELTQLAKNNGKLHIVKMDVTDYNSFPDIVNHVASKLNGNTLNLLVNNAGIFLRSNLEAVTPEEMIEVYNANTVAPLMVTKSFLPLLQASSKSNQKTVVVNITSNWGSIDNNTAGSMYAFRSSKTALNMVTRSLATDLRERKILVVAIHPGWIQSGVIPKGAISVVDSVSNMIRTIEDVDESVNGMMVNYDGTKLPW